MDPFSLRVVGSERAADLAYLWETAEAKRRGTAFPRRPRPRLVEKVEADLRVEGSLAVLGLRGGKPVACCLAEPLAQASEEARAAKVRMVAVAPPHWGKGYAGGAVAFLERRLHSSGFHVAELRVFESNDRARRVYERLGWVLVAEGEPHPSSPQAVYRKTLTAPDGFRLGGEQAGSFPRAPARV